LLSKNLTFCLILLLKQNIKKFCEFAPRSLSEAALADTPGQFGYLAESVGIVSDLQTQLDFRLRLLENKEKVKTCRDYEESEGRLNTDMLHRIIVIGGPQFPAGKGLQKKLVAQVR